MSAHEIVMPKTGLYVEDVLLTEWLVEEGTRVALDEPIILITTDKVDSEVPADADGWLHQEAEEDREYPIGTRLGIIFTTEDEYRAALRDGVSR